MKNAEHISTSSSRVHLNEKEAAPTFNQQEQSRFFSNNTSGTFFGGNCTEQPSFFNSAISRGGPSIVQPKLTIGQPNDKYEKEADLMADQVVQRLTTTETLTRKENGVQTKSLTAAPTPVIQSRCAGCDNEERLHKREEDDMQKVSLMDLWRKPIFESNAEPPDDGNAVHRKCAPCEQEEKLQMKAGSSEQTAAPDIESRLMSSKGSGSPLPSATREQMESSFGADFSNVRIHTGSNAEGMSKGLHAQAFTHGNDIYFNSGKYDTNSPSGKHLLSHELTHTLQQQSGNSLPEKKIQRWPAWVSDAADWVGDTASDVAGTVVEGAEAVGGAVADGARWVGGKVASGAELVVDQVSAAAQWVIDQIRSVINAGTSYLTEKWASIKEFGRTCFDDIKNGFGNIVHFVTNPLSSLMSALSMMNADHFSSVWNSVTAGANALWAGINSVVNGVLQIGRGIWDTATGLINSIFSTIEELFNNTAFDLLPGFIKTEARSIVNGLRSLWNQVSAFWTDLWENLTSKVQQILIAVRTFVDNIISFGIGKVIAMIRGVKEVYDYITKFFDDPRATIQPLLDKLAEKLNNEVPPKANTLGAELAQQHSAGETTQVADNGGVQRVPESSEDRRSANLMEVLKGLVFYVARAWTELDLKQLLWQTVVNMFWPPATIKAIVEQFKSLWNDHWATTVDSLYRPRNFFDDPLGCLHDIWSNFLILLDFPLSLWRTLNNVVALLMGYITIILVLVYAILGGIAAAEVGVVPGLLAGATLGLQAAAAMGEALMFSYILAEGLTVEIVLIRLFTARQVCEKRQVDIMTSVASFIAMAVALALQVLMALLAELVSLIANLLKGVPKPAPQPVPVQPVPAQPVPAQPVPAQPVPAQPVPAPPVPAPPVPVQPVPAQPPPPNVIPFRPRPVTPVTPANPGQIAAKHENGVSTIPRSHDHESSSLAKNEFGAYAKSTKNTETLAISEVLVSPNGIIQTQDASRESRIDPDACEPKKNICYERSLTFGINRTSMPFLGISPTPEDLRIAACLLRTATGTTFRAFGKNCAVGKFLVNGSYDYIPGVNIPRGNIHSEDIILIEAERRYGKNNYKLAGLFSERIPCYRCEGNLRGTPLTPDARIYCIINNDYDRASIMRAYNDGRLS